MRILITFPIALGTSGGGTVGCLRIAHHLAQGQDCDVCVLPLSTHVGIGVERPPCPDDLFGHAQHEELRDAGVDVIPVAPASRYLWDARAMRAAVRRELERKPADAVLGWHHEYSAIPRWARRRGLLTGAFAAGQYEHLARQPLGVPPRLGRIRERLQRRAIERTFCDGHVVFAISKFLGHTLCDVFPLPPERITVAPWGVAPIFAEARRPRYERLDRILFYGSAAVRKGIPDTMAALGRLAARGRRDWTLKLVAWDRELTRGLAREHGIEDRVVMLDPMPHEQLVDHLAWAQLAVLPSTYESFGLACAECQASGLPVIANDVGGVGEVVARNETGWLVPLQDLDALTAAIEHALDHPADAQRLGAAGRARMQELYTWPRTARIVAERLTSLADSE